MSGHCFFIGGRTKKIVSAQVSSKKCKICENANKKDETPTYHECPHNYNGSSKGMEAQNALHLTIKMYKDSKSKIFVENIVADDDSSLRALLKHCTPTSKKGKLPIEIPEPTFLADPGHRTKTVSKPIFALVKNKNKKRRCCRVDALRFKKYFSYMLKQNWNKSIDEICDKAQAVIEHLFNNHAHCDVQWCHAKQKENMKENLHDQCDEEEVSASDLKKPPTHPFKYRSKTKDSELYNEIRKAYEKYQTPERLRESLHPYDTQSNEAMNQSVSKYAPKNKSYGASMSLATRVSVAIGVFNLGHYQYWLEVYHHLGLCMSQTLSDHLKKKDEAIAKKRENQKKLSVKIKRSQKQIELTKRLIETEMRDKKRGLSYGSGMAITVLVPEGVCEKENEVKKLLDCNCELFGCYAGGHKTKKSKKCKYHTCNSNSEVEEAMDTFLRYKYPKFYHGEMVTCLWSLFFCYFASKYICLCSIKMLFYFNAYLHLST